MLHKTANYRNQQWLNSPSSHLPLLPITRGGDRALTGLSAHPTWAAMQALVAILTSWARPWWQYSLVVPLWNSRGTGLEEAGCTAPSHRQLGTVSPFVPPEGLRIQQVFVTWNDYAASHWSASIWFNLTELTVLVWARFYPHTGQETSHYFQSLCSHQTANHLEGHQLHQWDLPGNVYIWGKKSDIEHIRSYGFLTISSQLDSQLDWLQLNLSISSAEDIC